MIPVIFSLLVIAYASASPWDNLTANIAIIEFKKVSDKSIPDIDIPERNVLYYYSVIESIPNDTKIDMYIFPEASLGYTPETSIRINVSDNPCDGSYTYDDAIILLCNMAIKYSAYVVTNVVEKVQCENQKESHNENCKKTGYYYYNTNLVFDRDGKIILRYRKYNLFGEDELDRPEKPEVATFKTDFGIEFATFTCFDILFKNPASDVIKKKVDGIIYPTYWHSELPFLTALQSQEMFAHENDIMIFAAGGNQPSEATGGSGVHRGSKDSLFNVIVAKGGSEVMIYKSENGEIDVDEPPSVDELAKEMDVFPLMIDDSLSNYTWIPLNTSKTTIQEEVCHNDTETDLQFCCTFNIDLTYEQTTGNFYKYFLGAYSGIRYYPNICDAGLQVCALIACLDSSISSCGQRFPQYGDVQWPLTFNEITIKAKFELNENKTQFPNSLLSSIRPIEAGQTNWTSSTIKENGTDWVERTWSTKEKQNRILTFAIYGRNFAQDVFPRDNPEDTTGGSTMVSGMVLLLIPLLLVLTQM